MSDEYTLPDPKTPMRSGEEERALMQSPRYQDDPAYRAVIEAKLALGLMHPDAVPTGKTFPGPMRIQMGVEDPQVVHNQPMTVIFTEQDHADMQKSQRVAELGKQVRLEDIQAANRRAAQDLHYVDSPDFDPNDPKAIALSKVGFESDAQMVALLSTRAYRTSPAVQRHVQARMLAPRRTQSTR